MKATLRDSWMTMHPEALKAELRRRHERGIKQPLGWCRAERIRIGDDLPIMRVNGCLVVYCVKGMHRGCHIAWKPSGELLAIGSAPWVRLMVHNRPYRRLPKATSRHGA